MKIVISLILCILSQASSQIDTKSRGWRGIVPFNSTRAEVERLLGQGTNYQFMSTYHLEDARVLFHYSTGDCKSGRGAWDVPSDTVIWITIYPKPNPQFSDLKIDESKFKKSQRGHIEGVIYYDNEEEGLTLEVYGGRVQMILYGPNGKEKKLRCPR